MNKTIVSMVAEKIQNIINSERQLPWIKPWKTTNLELAVSYNTQKPYSLLNQLLLLESGEYITFKQIVANKGILKAGSKARQIIFWNFIEKKEEDTEKVQKIPFLKYYNVFRLADTQGIESKAIKNLNNEIKSKEEIEKIIDTYCEKNGIKLNKGFSNSCYYRPSEDSVTIPDIRQFNDISEYYSSVFHELVHSTGHENRLNRENKNRFGDEKYSQEELIAEIGFATIMSKLGLETPESLRNSASYIKGWQKYIKEETEAFISACGKAEKAVNMILGIEKESVEK